MALIIHGEAFGMILLAEDREPPRHTLRFVPAIQSIDRKRDDLRTHICRCCIPGKYSVSFRKSSTGSFFDPKNSTVNRRANTTYRHRRRLLPFRGAETIAYYHILFGFPACQLAAQSTGNTYRDSNYTAISRRESLFGQGAFVSA
jgi:hypothetical protein